MTRRRMAPWLVVCVVAMGCGQAATTDPDGWDGRAILPDSGGPGDSQGDPDVILFPGEQKDPGGIEEDLCLSCHHDEGSRPDLPPCWEERGEGCPCESGADCASGWCVNSWEGRVCVRLCVDECPAGMDCLMASSFPDMTFVCVPRTSWLCRPCRQSLDCFEGIPDNGARCLSLGDLGGYCGGRCQIDGDCPQGFICSEEASVESLTSRQCVPLSGECPCTEQYVLAKHSTWCHRTNEFGSCSGEWFCTGTGMSPCSAKVPGPEQCNGQDDNCNGETDEDVPLVPCVTSNEHGQCPGEFHCVDHVLVCHGPMAAPEECNEQDNNCNGLLNEPDSLGCSPYYRDEDNDGFGTSEAKCLCQPDGVFRATVHGDCNDQLPDVHPEAAETCLTEYDDNCDGNANEENAEGCLGYFEDLDSDGWGVGLPRCLCVPDGFFSAGQAGDCDPWNSQIYPGAQEICNGLDMDCDGKPDNGFADADSDGIADCVDLDIDGDGIPNDRDCEPYNSLVPSCTGKVCGDDGCGKSCGECHGQNLCVSGQCVCQPACAGRNCGPDGCGSTCGVCGANATCSPAGVCACDYLLCGGICCGVGQVCHLGTCCAPQCTGRNCGSDGCGGLCGLCTGQDACLNGVCTCQPACAGKNCGGDGCGGSCGMCPSGYVCQSGDCICQPNCAGKDCGSDGCGGSCGTCPGGFLCQSGICQCLPNCAGRDCGSDGCGGSCGTCPGGFLCQGGQCVCQPNCTGRNCGSDGCGGSCGTCPGGWLCQSGVCQCQPNCAGRTCGSDGCGGSCGTCPGGFVCSSGNCICQPSCTGKNCGSDGCGGSCGTCPAGWLCQSGTCQCQPSCAGKNCGADGCGGSCGTCTGGWTCSAGGVCQAPNPCGTITWNGKCDGDYLEYCHAPGNAGAPCTTQPNCELRTVDCWFVCFLNGYLFGFCTCPAGDCNCACI